MKKTRFVLAVFALCIGMGSYFLFAQAPAGGAQARGPAAPPQPMSFFVTSVSKGDGANYGGLAGADAYCQMPAQAAGSTKTFRTVAPGLWRPRMPCMLPSLTRSAIPKKKSA